MKRLKYPKKDYRRLYYIYKGMLRRCNDPNRNQYKDYGGRGISVCNEWLETFDNFAEWALQNGYQEGLTIDRIDNDGNYEPCNCRWATRKEQNRNKRNNLRVIYNGEAKCLREWCDILNLPYDQMRNRIVNLGWDAKRAFEKPILDFEKSLSHDARLHGMKPRLIFDRINKLGWSYEEAINTPVGTVDVTTEEYKIKHYGYSSCPVCGKQFIKQNFRMKYCSRSCCQKLQRETSKRKAS